jgi:ubiquinone/menaquinone biosynthesis C-methylase UbiE
MNTQTEYFLSLAAAFVRGKFIQHQYAAIREAHTTLFTKALDELSEDELYMLIQLGQEYDLRLHRFKKTMELPRVRKALGILKGIQPHNLLDIGSGRGAFLWPLLNDFPYLPVTCVDLLDYRVADMQAVHDGGIGQLVALQGNVTTLPFTDHSFDVVTMLEVLEHIPATIQAIKEVCRVARRFLLLSVPSKEDDNPEHIHLFSQQRLTELLLEQGITRVTVEYVLNHMIIVARIEHI